jgi:hypothetical protein
LQVPAGLKRPAGFIQTMAENVPAPAEAKTPPQAQPATPAQALGSATYEIIRQRLQAQGALLRERGGKLNARRQEVFGSLEFKLLQSDRIVTAHNCIPQDMVQLGDGAFLFGFNVQFGLKREMELGDVFAIYQRDGQVASFKEAGLELLQDPAFITDFKRLYNVYQKASFHKFSVIDGKLYMVFSIGNSLTDIAVFKWAYNEGKLQYIDGRAESEFRQVGFPPPFEFRWCTPDRESFRYGDHPHVSIKDRVFVECIGGDLTIKIEDNTATGEGVYAEPVEDKFQKVDDAEIGYAIVDHLILLKVRPYKETQARYFIFNEKTEQAVRADSIGQSCVFLPQGHGLIFPDGYYLATGELKQFESKEQGYVIERIIHSPNGEDSLYVFYQRQEGKYVLMPYRLISQKVEERITCHGFSIFPTGHLLLFRAESEPQKHHMIQLRQTPYHQPGHEPGGKKDAFLYQVGNKDVVRCLAECNEVLTLIGKESPYAELYTDLTKRCGAILDSYPWLNSEEGFQIDGALRQIRDAADKAVDEFDKVRRLQREAVDKLQDLRKRAELRLQEIRRASFRVLNDFVVNLAALRQLRGETATIKEVRYIDIPQVELIEKSVVQQTEELAKACVQFLLKPEALDPYRKNADEHLAKVEKVAKVAEGREIEKAVAAGSGELEMLIEIVNGLKIDDATATTRIIDGITAVFATLNQVRAALKKRLQNLVASESAEQFNAQIKLLSQAAASYLDLCDSPAKCDEYLNRISVQLEELEGTFAEFEEYTVKLSERRTELYEVFEQRKVALVEQRNKRAGALMTAAERILKVVKNRLASFRTLEEINSYMASDLMIGKVRETIQELVALSDSVKADDLEGRLKSAQQEAVRQLKDRQELFVDGQAVIRLGKHRFSVNTQPLELTIVNRDGVQHIHLTSTRYFEPITDELFQQSRDLWAQEVVSENDTVYRAEYLAYRLMQALHGGSAARNGADGDLKLPALTEALAQSESEQLTLVQSFMASRYQEGYTKGVHDLDAARIFNVLLSTHTALQLARFNPAARALAMVYWHRFAPEQTRTLWHSKLEGFGERNRLFPGDPTQDNYVAALRKLIGEWNQTAQLYPGGLASAAGEYLFYELVAGATTIAVSREADQIVAGFNRHLVQKGSTDSFAKARQELREHPESELELVRDWVRGFLLNQPDEQRYLEEAAAIIFCGDAVKRTAVQAGTSRSIDGMKGTHPVVNGTQYRFDYLDFRERLAHFEANVVPRYEAFQRAKQAILERERTRLRLEEFTPRVLTSFVRNQLIDEIYLPLLGDNLAKQIGAAGDQKRTDLMGLLLVISPPGYGKTTLMEYVSNRLGIIFVKINGPALGHNVTSLDPEAAPNAAAREEIQKLNLALEMGDNVMICVDDIQHCNPEFLQKFISLCDGQRKIEGVWKGQPRTYDLKGRKLVVVMAGNPYTESGQKFRIPDMLANRADTYNLGDIIGGNADWFKASYLENAVTSNAVLAPLANKSQKDIRSFIRTAETGSRPAEGFEGSYSAQEVEEILSVMKKLVVIRNVVLRVNQEYIHSAAQADEFRTEPPFRLQGSYRNMNRLAEKVVPVLNDEELRTILVDHYRNESQTLTTGAEANLLKFKELIGQLSAAELARWEEIKKTFKRNQLVRGADQNDPVSRVVGQLSGFQAGLESIQDTLEKQLSKPSSLSLDLSPLETKLESMRSTLAESLAATKAPAAPKEDPGAAIAAHLGKGLKSLGEELRRALAASHTGDIRDQVNSLSHELEMIHSTLATLKDLAVQQRNHLRDAQELLATRAKQGTVEIDLTQEMLTNERAFLEKFQEVLAQSQQPEAPKEPPAPGVPPQIQP